MKTKNGQTQAILRTELCKINDDGSNYLVYIKMSKGGWLEHNPFPRDLRGLVAALTLATEVCAGKFYPMALVPVTNTNANVDENTNDYWGQITGSIKQLNGGTK